MSKTLSTILTVFKVLRIVAKVFFVLCVVGAVGCLISAVALMVFGGLIDLFAEEGFEDTSASLVSIIGAIVCAAEASIAFLAERYFSTTVSDGTPFTFNGANACFRLGITSIVVSVAASIISGIVWGIFTLITKDASQLDANMSISLSTGLFFVFLSLIFKYGAEIRESVSEKQDEEK